MERDDFYPFMKVLLNSEFGVVTDQFWEGDGPYTVNGVVHHGTPYKCYRLIRWDINKREDFEDWRGQWGTFVALGGHEIDLGYRFKFINEDGLSKKIRSLNQCKGTNDHGNTNMP